MVFDKVTNKIFPVILPAILIMSATTGTALAHKLIANAWVEEDSVFIESAFSTGDPGKNAEVTVFDEQDNKLLTTATDENGECSFKIPKKSALKIIVNEGMGHQAKAMVPLEDIEEAFGGQQTPADEAAVPEAFTARADGVAAPVPVAGISARQMQTIIDKSLDKKLKPLIRKLSIKDEGGPEFKDIVGGIGYILGLMGVATYFNYRRRNKS